MFNKRKSNVDSTISSCYHDGITQIDQVNDLMRRHGDKEGSYLVRNSFREAGRLVLTIKYNSGLVHIKINQRGNNFIIGAMSFANLGSLLKHFSLNPIENEERLTGVILKHPIERDDPLNFATPPPCVLRNHNNGVTYPHDNDEGYLMMLRSTMSNGFNPRENSARMSYLTPSGVDRNSIDRRPSPTPPDLYNSTNTNTNNNSRHILSNGWEIVTKTGESMKFVSPSGEILTNLPIDVLVKLDDDQMMTMQGLLRKGNSTNDNHVYMDMKKSRKDVH